MTSRELVLKTLEFENRSDRAPRQLWTLPWATERFPRETAKILSDYPEDITGAPMLLAKKSPVARGDAYAVGAYVDDWGAEFENIHPGVIGEVKHPAIASEDEDWADLSRVHVPEEWLTFDRQAVRDFCKNTDKFVLAPVCPRPFEQMQFLRGTEQLYIDLMERPDGMLKFMERMHAFYCEVLEEWCRTDVDGVQYMDDWGAQRSLLINPATWSEVFAPMYRDYIGIAHRHGKKIFMHSDGHILSIYPRLIEMGLDAVNSQLFCMGLENVEPFAGKITFWGEIDRQHLLRAEDPAAVTRAVQEVHERLWRNGGCIAQCEFGPGNRPENVREVFRAWNEVTAENAN